MLKPIFICSGNICRSPMAQGLFTSKAREAGVRGMAISMGTLGLQGRRAAREAVEVCSEVGVDISGHRSQGLSRGILKMATHILVMEPHHRDAVLALDPSLAAKVHFLGDYSGHGEVIDDPVGHPVDVFRESREIIATAVDAFIRAVT